MQKALIIASILILCVTACQRKPPGNLIPGETLVPLLVDFHLNFAIQQSQNFRDIARAVDSIDPYSYLFDKYKITRADFDTTVSWYINNPELYVDIYHEVIMKLTQLDDSIARPEVR